jgi:ankyrin repeat protein
MPFNASVQALIEFHYDDLDTTAQDSDGMNIAHHVSRSKSSSPADLDRCYPKSLATLDNEGKSLLHHACQRGNLDIVERLLGERDEALACRDYHGRTLMHYATESSRCAETIDILLREGFGIHEKDCRDRTVMHHAASKGILKAVEKLLDLGAAVDLEALDKDGRTPLQLAAWCSSHAVVDFLRSHCGAEQADDLPEERVVWHEKEKKVTDEVAGFDLKSWLIMFMVVGSMTRWLLFRS